MSLIRARHDVLGVADVPDTDFYRETGWVEVDADTPTAEEAASQAEVEEFHREAGIVFDPSAHNVDEVRAHLAEADEDERRRVLEAEEAGNARVTLLES